MKSRALWGFVVFAAVVLAAVYWWKNKTPTAVPAGAPTLATTPANVAPPATAVTPTSAASPAVAGSPTAAVAATKPKIEVPIQEGKTIDFSSGVAIVKDDAKQKAIIDKSVKDMDSAAAGVTFAPPASAQKKAEPPPR